MKLHYTYDVRNLKYKTYFFKVKTATVKYFQMYFCKQLHKLFSCVLVATLSLLCNKRLCA